MKRLSEKRNLKAVQPSRSPRRRLLQEGKFVLIQIFRVPNTVNYGHSLGDAPRGVHLRLEVHQGQHVRRGSKEATVPREPPGGAPSATPRETLGKGGKARREVTEEPLFDVGEDEKREEVKSETVRRWVHISMCVACAAWH